MNETQMIADMLKQDELFMKAYASIGKVSKVYIMRKHGCTHEMAREVAQIVEKELGEKDES